MPESCAPGSPAGGCEGKNLGTARGWTMKMGGQH